MSAKTQAAQPTSRVDLDALYKPVGINAVTAAAMCCKSAKTAKGGTAK
jgi:hypothetical protein